MQNAVEGALRENIAELTKVIPRTLNQIQKKKDDRPLTDVEKMISSVIEKYAIYNSDALISDHIDDLVCFCDPAAKHITEIFTSNNELKASLENEINAGRKCFELLKGRTTPCPFCTDELLVKDRYYVWPYHDLATDNTYIHKSRTILREGKSVRMEVLQDVTDPDRKDVMLTQALKSMRLWAECARLMSHDYPFKEALSYLLKEMVAYLNAETGYLVFFDNDELRSTWPVKNMSEIPPYFEDPTQKAIDTWSRAFINRAYVYLDDISHADLPDQLKDIWLEEGRISLLSYPLFVEDELRGALCLNNVTMNTLQAGMIDLIAESIIETYQRYERHEKEELLKYHDGMSGALNMDGFRHVAYQIIDENPNSKYAFWYSDIRNFRYINDLFGYETGLQFVNFWIDQLSENLNTFDLFARNSIDSIVALQKYNSIDEITDRFNRRIKELAKFPEFEKRGYHPELVCGVYLVSPEELKDPDFDRMLNRASIAQKVARDEPGCRVTFYDEDLRARQLREIDIKQGAQTGLENNEFFIELQPQYRYETNEMVGAEALVRWQHPRFGLLSPDQFIPLLEQTGRITDLDLYVCEEACKVLGDLLKQRANEVYDLIPISVNLSRVDVQTPDLTKKLLEIMDRYEVPTSLIRFEITESAFIEAPDTMIRSVDELRRCGFSVEMDDFGSGYSSLTTLKNVAVDVLKLDMAFLEDGYNEGRAGQILKSVIDMADNIGLLTLAEGVETAEQAQYLHSLNCKIMQGFYFAKPLSVESFKKLYQGTIHN